MSNSLTSNIFNGTDGSENVTGLDLSDFPALADRSRRDGSSNPTPQLNPLAGRAPYVGMVTKPSSEQTQDFSIHNEDFPALPGPNYQTKDPSSNNDDKTVWNLFLITFYLLFLIKMNSLHFTWASFFIHFL
ncbi:CCR4-NOT transcription complex subunit 2 [Ataeniobius toweri]|uniref:CCR4-NOT transcription complex subunit 2 n=1 Tax=Ataeniobius toweri TaxID=208326 RepID=A0ABU7BPP9_9TELE|nr:CCR4-NOT transcription complex subunit 2 [Ataeniobius toweri]